MTTEIAVLDASVGDTPAERNLRREVAAGVEVFKLRRGCSRRQYRRETGGTTVSS